MSTQAQTSSGAKTTPISAFQFQVYSWAGKGQTAWIPKGKVGFTNVSGLGNSTEAIEYKEGNDLYGDNLPGRSRPSTELTLTRGMDMAGYLLKWRRAVLEGTALPMESVRQDVIVEVYERTGAPGSGGGGVPSNPGGLVQVWRFYQCWPRELSVDDLDARGGTEITLQRLMLIGYGIPEQVYPPRSAFP